MRVGNADWSGNLTGSRPRQGLRTTGRPTAAELKKRKDRIIAVATEMFVQVGWGGTSLVEVARRAGVATRTIYQHYGGKFELFSHVVRARETSWQLGAIVADGDSLESILRSTAYQLVDFYLSDESLTLQRLTISESQRFPDLFSSMIQDHIDTTRAAVASVLAGIAGKGANSGAKTGSDADFFLDLIIGRTALHMALGHKGPRPSRQETDAKVSMFIKGRLMS